MPMTHDKFIAFMTRLKTVIQDPTLFDQPEENLRAQITPGRNKTISVILNIDDIHVYSQVFNLPAMNLANFEEAAKLNLQMVSPMDFDKAYSDWQIAGESKADGGQTDVLGVFIQASIVNAPFGWSSLNELAEILIQSFTPSKV